MALDISLLPSPFAGVKSAFSPWADSASSPVPFVPSPPDADALAHPPSSYPPHVDPSPTDSNDTESTNIEEDAQSEMVDYSLPDIQLTNGESAVGPEGVGYLEHHSRAGSRSNTHAAGKT